MYMLKQYLVDTRSRALDEAVQPDNPAASGRKEPVRRVEVQ